VERGPPDTKRERGGNREGAEKEGGLLKRPCKRSMGKVRQDSISTTGKNVTRSDSLAEMERRKSSERRWGDGKCGGVGKTKRSNTDLKRT